jgi:uncharacterized protein YkwD
MLQFYDKPWSISVLAFAALSTPLAAADSAEAPPAHVCNPGDGYGVSLGDYTGEARACLDQTSDAGLQAKTSDVRMLIQRIREKAGVDGHSEHASLDAAARMHALDMAARGFASHSDLEGRGHEQRIRAMSRQLVFGALGANITVVNGDASAVDIYNALIADEISQKNLFRDVFTHAGLGLAKADGRIYAVQLFAQVDGELSHSLPVRPPALADISVSFVDSGFEMEGWRIEDRGGWTIARGKAPRLNSAALGDTTGYLTLQARRGTDIYSLKGPAVSAK